MRVRRTAIIGGIVAAIAAVGAGVAVAGAGDDDATERPIPEDVRARAEAAALEHTGGGRVTGTEVDDEESRYEVEVTLADGTQVDVQLDDDLEVVGDERDDDEAEDE